MLTIMPAAHPASSAPRCSHRVYRPIMTEGSVCRMIAPPSSCRSMENCGLMSRMNSRAPTFTSSETILLVVACSCSVASRRRYSL